MRICCLNLIKILNLSFVLKCLALGFVSLSWIARSEDLDQEFEPPFPLEEEKEEKEDANDVDPGTDQKRWLLPVVTVASGVVIGAGGFVHSFLKFRERLASSRFQPFEVVEDYEKGKKYLFVFGSEACFYKQAWDNKRA